MRRRANQPTRRDEALAALSRAARLWMDRGLSGDPLARAVAHVLSELNVAARAEDLDALQAKGGPARWAAAYEKNRDHEALNSAAGTARGLVRVIERWIGSDPMAFADRSESERLAEAAHAWLRLNGVSSGLVPAVPAEQREAQRRTIATLVRKVARRARPDAKAFAVAILQGWGLEAAAARNALKDKDA